ncbi:WD domain repeat-containing protein 55 [Coemansia nantahalensis]|uniref:WD domain repeat-containing protein 55 n=2 Tax=Coemansia TaxID=4863 RepID=A0ACC1L0Z8_9FUNG|nr:WD domain repeat-containing protein 55 [Coemansia nantahalensis]KAJ2775126.1 WD domain repeat-containing protein 55 [Coemansia nantahalensis]KAJ2798320.1 WD domain repeat-containing protein 55 [Coemansia helicoidea]
MDDSAVRPKSLRFKEPVVDVAFSPQANLVASTLITGHVFVHKYSVDGNERQHRCRPHKKSCRSVCFSGDGARLYTGSKDRSWQAMDVATGAEIVRFAAAHDKPVNIVKYVNEQVVATGDEAGCVKLWDTRQGKQAFAYTEHVDYISDMVFCPEKRHLLAASGDGCLSVYDVRKANPFQVSANQDDELLSLAIIRGGKKVVTGQTDGVLGIFSYGQFGDVSDRFPGHPQSIDTICKLTEDLCVTGSSDGLLRIVQFFPHKLVGVAGDHQALPVEKVVLSHDQQWLASCSHDHMVHFWDIGYIFNDDSDSESQHDSDGDLDAQAAAIRVSKEVAGNDSDSEVDIDGISDAGELRAPEADSQAEEPAGSDGSGWGSSDDDDDGGSSSNKKKAQKMTRQEKLKAKRKARAELALPAAKQQKRNKKSAAFFSGL